MKATLVFVNEIPRWQSIKRTWMAIHRYELEQFRGKWTVMKTGKPSSLNTYSHWLKKRWPAFDFAVRGERLYVRAKPREASAETKVAS